MVALLFVYAFDYRVCYFGKAVHLAFEYFEHGVGEGVYHFFRSHLAEFGFREWRFYCKNLHYLVTEAFVIVLRMVSIYGVGKCIVNGIYGFYSDAFAKEGVMAAQIYHFTLHIHHIVVFEQAFTNTEVVLFYLLLSSFDRFRYHLVLNHLTFLESEAVHYFGYSFRSEETHKVVFERYVEYGRARVALTS